MNGVVNDIEILQEYIRRILFIFRHFWSDSAYKEKILLFILLIGVGYLFPIIEYWTAFYAVNDSNSQGIGYT